MNFHLLTRPLVRNLNLIQSSARQRYLSQARFVNRSASLTSRATYPNSIYLNTDFFSSTFTLQKSRFSKSSNYKSKMPPIESSIGDSVEKLIKENKIVVFSKTTCPFCVKAKELLAGITDKTINAVQLDVVENGSEMQNFLHSKTGQRTVPNIFIDGYHIGGFDNLKKIHNEGRLVGLLEDKEPSSEAESGLRPKPNETIAEFVDNCIKTNKVMIFSKSTCPFCAKIKELFNSLNEQCTFIELDKMTDGTAIRDYLYNRTGQKTLPNVYVNGTHLGGSDSTMIAHNEGRLANLLKNEVVEDDKEYDYDLLVIGGGSGGLAASKQAATLGVEKVAVLDYVVPSPRGSKWGLGGTCVNVGCIPKKLMHQAALLGEALEDSKPFGWQTPDNIKHNWETMIQNIQDHIGSLNWGYRVQLRDKKVEYINAYGSFVDEHTVLMTPKNAAKAKQVTAKKIIVAVGGRPKYPDDVIGIKENTITSDDLFSLSYSPGKTLCVGASYVSLECAGFLKGIGLDVTVMVRSILLRGFDQQMANLIGDYMEKHGMKFIRSATPSEIIQVKAPEEGVAPGEYIVKYKDAKTGEPMGEETFNTIVMAVGRDPCTETLNLEKANVKINPKNKKILTNFEQTNVDHIYAIGDVVDESSAGGLALELTPVAIQAGQFLSKRIFGKSDVKMDYINVATTVFTPIEYGAIGLSEEDAIKKLGEENIEVYHQNFWPLEWTVAHKPHDVCYAKLICNKKDNERVIGLHVAGPNAGEITQGYAVAFKLRATKNDFNNTIGIHPTESEVFTTLNVTKSSGGDIAGGGC